MAFVFLKIHVPENVKNALTWDTGWSWFIALTCVDFILDILMLCHGENHLNQTEKYAWQDRKDELIPRSVLTGWAKKTARGISHFDLFPQFSPLRSLLSVSPARHLATLARAEHCGVRMNFATTEMEGETTNCWNNFVLTSRSASQTKLFQHIQTSKKHVECTRTIKKGWPQASTQSLPPLRNLLARSSHSHRSRITTTNHQPQPKPTTTTTITTNNKHSY